MRKYILSFRASKPNRKLKTKYSEYLKYSDKNYIYSTICTQLCNCSIMQTIEQYKVKFYFYINCSIYCIKLYHLHFQVECVPDTIYNAACTFMDLTRIESLKGPCGKFFCAELTKAYEVRTDSDINIHLCARYLDK